MHATYTYFSPGLPQIFVCPECSAVYERTGESITGEPLFSFRFHCQLDDD